VPDRRVELTVFTKPWTMPPAELGPFVALVPLLAKHGVILGIQNRGARAAVPHPCACLM